MARRYARDNRGRFASVGATARGGRLRTDSGNTRQTQTRRIGGAQAASTVNKPRDLKPGALSGRVKPSRAATRANQLRERAAQLDQRGTALMSLGRADRAVTNVSLSSRTRQSETNAGFRGLEMTRTASALRSRASQIEEKAAQSAAKALREAATAKKTRSIESYRLSRAKQVEKRRGMNISNPAGWNQESAGRMAANAARTQERAIAFYKGQTRSRRAA